MGLFGKRQFGLAALEPDRSVGDRQKARDHPQQRGLARSIGPGNRQRFTGGRLKIEA